jgi:hypothetical protein
MLQTLLAPSNTNETYGILSISINLIAASIEKLHDSVVQGGRPGGGLLFAVLSQLRCTVPFKLF